MTKRVTYLASAASLALAAIFASTAQAAYTQTYEEVGGNVVEVGMGTLNTTDLTDLGSPFSETAAVGPAGGTSISGSITGAPVEFFSGLSDPGPFGPGIQTDANSSSGDIVGVQGANGEPSAFLFTPAGYVSGASLSETMTFDGATFASLGVTPGEYVFTWGTGASADTFTVDFATSGAAPEPATWAMMLIGFAGLSYAAARRKSAAPSNVQIG